LDNKLFSFKGITGEQFKAAVQTAKTYEELWSWLQANGTNRTPAEIKAWSDELEADCPMKNPERRASFIESCNQLGLNPEKSTTFDLLEADDPCEFPTRIRTNPLRAPELMIAPATESMAKAVLGSTQRNKAVRSRP